jgi:hypothetical protein
VLPHRPRTGGRCGPHAEKGAGAAWSGAGHHRPRVPVPVHRQREASLSNRIPHNGTQFLDSIKPTRPGAEAVNRLPAATTRCDSASEPGLVPAPGEADQLPPAAGRVEGGVCDDCARCGLSEPCPDHRPPEEHHLCARARIHPTRPSAGSARQTAGGSVTVQRRGHVRQARPARRATGRSRDHGRRDRRPGAGRTLVHLGPVGNVYFQRSILMAISADSVNWVRSVIFRPQAVRAA